MGRDYILNDCKTITGTYDIIIYTVHHLEPNKAVLPGYFAKVLGTARKLIEAYKKNKKNIRVPNAFGIYLTA